jgi:VWFA-related protein
MRILLLSAACWACASPAFAQEQAPARQGPDVVRVNTSLVQTDVMVFDKQGGFVDGLKREQFALKIDGKPRDISFFERIVAGSRTEEAQLSAARGNSAGGKPGAIPLDRGRTVFFFIDDLHLSPSSMKQARLLLERFIDREMGQNDEAEIASSSGQIGFLQQLTDDKRVLQAASDRLLARTYETRDSQRPPMSEYQAHLIEANNYDVLEYFVDELIRLNANDQLPRNLAADEVRGRASQIANRGNFITAATLDSLRALVKNASALPGRKLIFLVSDGFLLDNRNSDSNERLRQITSAAAAAGVIIYSIDARGLTYGMPDASAESPFDPSGRLARSAGGELGASQDGLNALAVDTGGRAFFNSNSLSLAVTKALKETSTYYLLSWRPENEEQRNPKSRRIEVSVNGRPDLVIRFRRSFGDFSPAESASRKKKESQAGPKPTNNLIGEALRSAYPKSDLAVAISLNFLDIAQVGPTLTTSIKISTSSLMLEAQEAPFLAEMDVAGGVFDDHGRPVSTFNKHVTIKSKSPPPDGVLYNHFCVIKPGLYQVRIAAVDTKQGHSGSAVRWIEIPDLGSKMLTLSSLIVGERKAESESQPSTDETETGKTASVLRHVSLNVDHHFVSSSHLRFLTFVYNAIGASAGVATTPVPASQGTVAPGNNVPASSTIGLGNGPDLAVQVQLFRDNEPVITTPLHKIQVEGTSDLRRLPYAAELNLDGLQPGRYLLLVTVIDRRAKASASQRFGFQID